MNKMLIGWAEESITPDKKVSLAGQFAERISEYVEKPITATAMAVECGDEQMIMVSCDLVGVSANLLDAIRDAIKDNTVGIDPNKVIISAIHNHTGPIYARKKRVSSNPAIKIIEDVLGRKIKYIEKENVSNNPDIISQEETFDFLTQRIAKVIISSWENRKEGSFVNAFGRAAVGMCRRATYSDGSALMWGETNQAVFEGLEAGSDTGIELMYVFGENDKLTGIVANLACPAQCVQHRLFVSPDFWGEVKVLLRKRFGEEIFLLPQCSAAGDQCPVDIIRWVEPYSDVNDPNIVRKYPVKRKADPSMFDLEGMRLTGRRIAREIIQVYEDGLDEAQKEIEFVHEVHNMPLPLRRVTLEEKAAAERGIREYFANTDVMNYNDSAHVLVHTGTLARFEVQNEVNVSYTEVHIVKMGSVAIATNPFELFIDYGNQIKARSNAEQTFLVQLANGQDDYLPTKKAELGGHYSAYVSSGLVGHEGGDLLVRNTLQEINKLF